jgi:hypothetical protein
MHVEAGENLGHGPALDAQHTDQQMTRTDLAPIGLHRGARRFGEGFGAEDAQVGWQRRLVWTGAYELEDHPAQHGVGGAELLEGDRGRRVGVAGEGEQQVLGPDDGVPQAARFLAGQRDDATGARGEAVGHRWNLSATPLCVRDESLGVRIVVQ